MMSSSAWKWSDESVMPVNKIIGQEQSGTFVAQLSDYRPIWQYDGTIVLTPQLTCVIKTDVFQQRCIRTITGNSGLDHVDNDKVLRRAMLQPLSDIVTVWRLNLAGHIIHLPEERPTSVTCLWQTKTRQITEGMADHFQRSDFLN